MLASDAMAGSEVTPWHATPAARRILAGMAFRPPALIRHERGYVMTKDEWLAYDHNDPRWVRLNAVCDAHVAPWLASEDACRDGRTAIAMGCTVDQAIDAMQDQPALFNMNDPDERRTWAHLRAEIVGVTGRGYYPLIQAQRKA
jgi:hypothetical protein